MNTLAMPVSCHIGLVFPGSLNCLDVKDHSAKITSHDKYILLYKQHKLSLKTFLMTFL